MIKISLETKHGYVVERKNAARLKFFPTFIEGDIVYVKMVEPDVYHTTFSKHQLENHPNIREDTA